jgi:hypothetical protein
VDGLDLDRLLAGTDQQAAAWGLHLGPVPPQHRALEGITAQDQARRAHLPEALEEGFERGAGGPSDAAGQHHVEADVLAHEQEVGQGGERVGGGRRHPVVVVHDQVVAPAREQRLRRLAIRERAEQLPDQLLDLLGRAAAPPDVGRVGQAGQPPPVVHDRDRQLAVRSLGAQLADAGPQQVGLAASAVPQDQEVGAFAGQVDDDR